MSPLPRRGDVTSHGVTLPTSLTGCENAYYTPVRRGADKCGRLECMRTSPNLEISTACQYPPGSQYGEEPIGSYWRNRLYRSHLLFSEEETFRDGRDRMCLPGHISRTSRFSLHYTYLVSWAQWRQAEHIGAQLVVRGAEHRRQNKRHDFD
ncbi:hypothetical protein BLNAU_16401 [Blattamonas nauphoetae]|uniref:Uncharacterized protein n=1 Tax=Blattamonas nauphoetae TaxID=2049346 RepID=A0ABQ9XBP5_9EUKA|nr:hypothetical protein BLNAU_16401 [Blattamonas nauphoetae]